MAIFFSLAFTLALLVIGLILFCSLAIPTWLLLDRLVLTRLSKVLRIRLPLVLVPLAYALLSFCFFMWFTRPTALYEMAFSFSPTSDVTISASKHNGIGDFGELDLTFTANKITIDKILDQRFNSNFGEATSDSDGYYRFKSEYSESFTSETAELEYNPATGKARYRWQGID